MARIGSDDLVRFTATVLMTFTAFLENGGWNFFKVKYLRGNQFTDITE